MDAPPSLVEVSQSAVDGIDAPDQVNQSGRRVSVEAPIQRDAILLCQIVISSGSGWVHGSQIGDRFRAAIDASGSTTAARDLRARYCAASTRAIDNGWILKRHPQLLPDGAEGEIVITSSKPKAKNLSKTQYVKVTQLGLLFLDSKKLVSENNAKTVARVAAASSTSTSGPSHPATSTSGPKQCTSSLKPDVTASLLVKNISDTVSLAALVVFVEHKCGCTVLQACRVQPYTRSAFYFARIVLCSSQQATSLLRIADNQSLELHGRVMAAAYDRFPFPKAVFKSNDPDWWYSKPTILHRNKDDTCVYIDNLPNGTNILHFVADVEERFSVVFERAAITERAKPSDFFWNAHAKMKTPEDAQRLQKIGGTNSEGLSSLVYGNRTIWVKKNTSKNLPHWNEMKQIKTLHHYCRESSWAMAVVR